MTYPDVRHIVPDCISLEPTADDKVVEALVQFLHRQHWLVASVEIE